MKGLPLTLLALFFAFFSLISLLMVSRDSDSRASFASDDSERVSELGLRFNFQR